MSNHLDPEDLLDADGKVDSTAVKSIANANVDPEPRDWGVSAEECAAWREELKGAPSVSVIVDDVDVTESPIKKHVAGRCSHDHDTPPLEYHRNHHGKCGGVWKRPDDVSVCPECDSASLKMGRVTGSGIGHRDGVTDKRFRCADCGAAFDDPEVREKQTRGETRKGLAGKLARADPDDVGGE